ncbi:transglutaminase-like domain-containing protein [Flavobacterium degerlachei]|jgi:transglutaminase-like putative cysteine protease|uniref:Transglutaminase-like superfamily protein n=1 Tax=Flavobacterium degerlachei TaxID=229203 RepID=A0A1H2ZDN9_9FLAO|nr:transglutaminase-like domain-containing protein [Flavobacterium degerlachei]SDX15501.1 Transglutaminase-like superfamily protein [Flavobacterium degerlachei]
MKQYTEETFHFDLSNEKIQNAVTFLNSEGPLTEKEFAVKAYLYVRDNWPYYPYRFSLINEDWRASELIAHKRGHCIDKVVILIAILRAVHIPARLGLAKVKNHIAVDQIVEKFGSDVLVPHGYIEMYLDSKWIKATPAFNKELCELLNVHPLEFDGETDSVFQEFDKNGNQEFMQYLQDYGTFNEVPLPFMFQLMKEHYPKINESGITLGGVLNLSNL